MRNFVKKSLFSVLTLIMVVALIFPTLNVSANSKDAEKYEMKVSYGIDGKYRAMKYVPVTVEVKSLEEDFDGEIEIRVASGQPGYYDAYSESINVAKGETIKVILPIKIPESNNKFTVNLIENGNIVLEQKVIGSKGRVTEAKVFTGVLTDDITSLGYLGDVKYKNLQSGIELGLDTVKLDSNIIDGNHLNIDGLDIIFINNFNMGSFEKEHYETLNNWVNKGGILIIGAGVNESKTVKAIDKSLLEVKSNGLSEKSVTLVNEDLNLTLSDLEIKNAKVKLINNSENLIYSVEKGKGEIVVTTFDLGMEPLIGSKDASEVWNEFLLGRFTQDKGQMMYGNNYTYEAGNLINNIPVDKVISAKTLAIIFITYALIIGVILYIVLKKIKKRDLIWIAIPVLSIAFAGVIYMLGGGTRVNDLILNQVNIIDMDKEGKSSVKGYVGVGTKYKNNVTLQKPEDIVMNYVDQNERYYGGSTEEKALTNLRVKTSYKDGNSYFDFADSNALEMKLFEVLGKEEVLPKIESKFNYDSGELKGYVKNNLDSNINKLILVTGDNLWDLGAIKKGEELNVENIKNTRTGGLRSYGDELSRKYWELRYDKNVDLKSEEFKNISRYGNVLQVLSNEVFLNNESRLIAITDMPIDYGIDFGSKSLSKYDTTVLLQDVEIDFKDKDGNVNYPQGYFKGVVESSTANVHIDDYSGDIYGIGEVIYNFKIDDEIEVLNMEINVTESIYGSKGGNMGFASEYYVYNYKDSNYEKINLTIPSSITLGNIENYIKDNNLKVKIDVIDNGTGRLPNISIKGRVK